MRGAFFTLRFVSPHAKKTYNVVRFEGRPFLGIQELLKLFYENDFEPARFERLLAFGYMVTDIPQGTGTIIAPGEAYTHKKQGPASPCINRAEKRKNGKVIAVERHLGLHYHADKFEPHERFLVMSR